jgi:hypothetical protein
VKELGQGRGGDYDVAADEARSPDFIPERMAARKTRISK